MKAARSLHTAVLIAILALTIFPCVGQQNFSARIARLEHDIAKTLEDTHTPAAGIAIVTTEGPLLVKGFGQADIAHNKDANENTVFRIASVSKMFVALSILKLQEEGKLSLDDKVRDVVPEIAFDNPWEETDPVRIVHLLEHTTGWDEQHLVEQTNVQLTLKEGLDYHPHSRRSRWVPGSRMAYCNSGYGVAGYIVEKLSGQPYEEYVEDNFFRPLEMQNSTFFIDERYQRFGATLYDGNLHPMPYRHVIQRPAGAINSSPADMARYIRFLLNRGRVDSVTLVRETSIERMEVSRSTPAAKAGLELGYGLANFSTTYKGFVFQGHSGGLPGALSELAYLPEHGIGYVILLNARNGRALSAISDLVRDFQIESIQHDSVARQPLPLAGFSFHDGYYIPVNPRIQWGYFMDRLIDVYEIKKKDSVLVKSWIIPGASETFYPVSDSQFRSGGLNKVGMVKAIDPLAGEVLVTGSRVYAPIPMVIAYGQLCIVAAWIGMMGVGMLMWILSLVMFWTGRSRTGLMVTSAPALATVFALVSIYLMVRLQTFQTESLTAPGLLSLTLLAVSVWFVLSTIVSVISILRYRRTNIPRIIYWSAAILSALHLVVAAYLMWFDIIPIISWS